MLFWCCGPRQKREKTPDAEAPPHETLPQEVDWLLGDAPNTSYTNPEDKSSRHETDLLREIVREAESKMVNITDRQPFLFHNPLPTSSNGNSNNTSFDEGSSTSSLSGPSYSRQRGGYNSGPLSPYQGNYRHGRKDRHQEARSDRSTSDPHIPRDVGRTTQHRHKSHQRPRTGHDRDSRSSSLNRSYRSNSSSAYSLTGEPRYRDGWDVDEDEYYHPNGYDDDYRYDLYGNDIEEEEEPLPIPRLRGPKLNVRIIPFPGREADAEEAARRARLGYGVDVDDYDEEEPQDYVQAQSEGDGDLTPVQGLVRPPIAPRPSTATVETARPNAEDNVVAAEVEVTPLTQEDHDAIVALSEALWTALESGLSITDTQKVVQNWDD